MKTGACISVFIPVKNVCTARGAQISLGHIRVLRSMSPSHQTVVWCEGYQPPPTKHTTSRWSASVRELRARNDGAVLLDSHTLRVVAELIQQAQYGALCGHCVVFSVNFHANILFSARKNAPVSPFGKTGALKFQVYATASLR